MGTLRTILATLVVCSHLRPITDSAFYLATGGAIFAVKAFFILSGFYMALVLHEQYRDRPVQLFYASRLSRLLPLYWFVGISTLLAEALLVPRGQYFNSLVSPMAYGAGLQLEAMPWPILLYIIISVGTMVGLDTGQWMGFSKITGAIGFSPDFVPDATSVMALSPVPPAWTIGIELLFYLFAPSLVRQSTPTIVLLGLASLAFRFGAAGLGLSGDPWNRSLFPSELIYFLMGILAFRVYLRLPKLRPTPLKILQIAPFVVAISIGPISKFAYSDVSKHAPFISDNALAIIIFLVNSIPYVVVAACVPFLFDRSKNSAIVNRIGDLSYPIYIGHLLVMGTFQLIVGRELLSVIGTGWTWLFCNLALVIVVAAALDLLIAAPVDRWRRRFGARKPNYRVPLSAPLHRSPVSGAIEVADRSSSIH